MKNINQHYQLLIQTMECQYGKVVAQLTDHIGWLERELNNYKDLSSGFEALKKEHEELVSEHNSLKFKFSQHEDAYDRVLKENLKLKNENKQLKKELPNNIKTAVSPATAKKVQKPVKTKAKKSGKTRGAKPKNILRHCIDCKKYYYSASTLSKRCDSCKLKHMHEYRKEWKKNRAKK